MKSKIRLGIILGVIIIVAVFIYFYFPSLIADSVYPLKYRDEIKKYAKNMDLDPNFVCGVIFTESRFNPESTSPVGAIGLMQIMPMTGLSIARHLGDEKNYQSSQLYDPETNIKYGTWYLKNLTDKYRGNQTLILIAYNGGVPLADRYAVQKGLLNSETYFFVGKVQNHQKIYQQIYGDWWKEAEKKKKPNLSDLIVAWLLGI